MPFSFTHAAAGFAAAAWTAPAPPPRKVLGVAAVCGAIPDLDLIGWPLQVSNASLFGHRALTHSLSFACGIGLVVAWTFFRSQPARIRWRLAASFALATATHGLLDGLSRYSLGVEYFAPFSARRYRLPWTPLGDPVANFWRVWLSELFMVGLCFWIGWIGLRLRRRSLPHGI